MFSAVLASNSIPLLEQVANFTQARHNVLAGNVANLDTPGYRTRDISPAEFQNRLKEALATRDSAQATGVSLFSSAEQPFKAVKDSLHGILRHDDANVGLEQQVAELSKNQMEHNLAVTILSSQFRLLQAAISERV